MVCRPCQAAGNQSEAAYRRKMTGEGSTYQEGQKERVVCGECRKEMAAGSLASHRMMHHGKVKEEQWSWEASATGGGPRTYWMAFPTKGVPRSFPVEGCPGRAGTQTAMRMNFCSRNVRDIVIILEEGNLPHPRCSRCDMLVLWRVLNRRHHDTAMCRKGAEQKQRRMKETELRKSTERAFKSNTERRLLSSVSNTWGG